MEFTQQDAVIAVTNAVKAHRNDRSIAAAGSLAIRRIIHNYTRKGGHIDRLRDNSTLPPYPFSISILTDIYYLLSASPSPSRLGSTGIVGEVASHPSIDQRRQRRQGQRQRRRLQGVAGERSRPATRLHPLQHRVQKRQPPSKLPRRIAHPHQEKLAS